MLRILAGNEWQKAWKRPVFYVTLGLLVVIDLLGFGYSLLQSLRVEEGDFVLPYQWVKILGDSTNVPLIFAGIVVVQLVGSEFSWRTARQNVIDGLSRGEWYWGKALIAALVVVLFCLVHVGLGSGLAWYGTPSGATGLFSATHAAALGGLVVAAVGYAASALFVASLFRSPGGAMAIWLFYVIAAENLIRSGLGRLWEEGREVLVHMPINTFDRARSYLMYDADALAAVATRAAEAGRQPPTVGDPATVLAVALAWIAGLAIVGWLVFRRRDL